MNFDKDVLWAVAAIGLLALAGYYELVIAPPAWVPRNGWRGANESPAKLYPACDYFPDGFDGKPCADAKEHERTGRLVFYEHYPDKVSSYTHPR